MICEYNAECTRDAVAIVRELSQDQSTLSETPVCGSCMEAWLDAERDRFFRLELVGFNLSATQISAVGVAWV